ncbi:hypothetical protein RUM44_005071 [Polyplax serrata]|uniref:Uncharacterized protein n=1 Tax=Polyplax serrata TaxID=468196 RepID=A0ABR1AWV1_POLSC
MAADMYPNHIWIVKQKVNKETVGSGSSGSGGSGRRTNRKRKKERQRNSLSLALPSKADEIKPEILKLRCLPTPQRYPDDLGISQTQLLVTYLFTMRNRENSQVELFKSPFFQGKGFPRFQQNFRVNFPTPEGLTKGFSTRLKALHWATSRRRLEGQERTDAFPPYNHSPHPHPHRQPATLEKSTIV